jgi:putative Mg2+ transporter-C (MgtC) family protein
MAIDPEVLLKIALAIVIGGLVGAEREYRDKSAGFRTLIFICLGAALFTMHSMVMGITRDPARVAAAVVSGVGFLGGGAILRGGMNVRGLTTAATIWLTAALGMGIGAGYYGVTLPATVAVLIVLWVFPLIEGWIDGLKTSRKYDLVGPRADIDWSVLEAIFGDCGLKTHGVDQQKQGDSVVCSVYVTGPPASHRDAIAKLLELDEVHQLKY